MIYRDDLFNPVDLQREIHEGFVKVQKHQVFPLDIYNYTDAVQYARRWNRVTTQTRGLVVDRQTGEVIARPFPKFFNYGEEAGTLDLDSPVEVMDKIDGSLGILYFYNGVPAIATRGSFHSVQAEHATLAYVQRYHGKWVPDPHVTYLFEIVFPENRIVLNYGDLDDIILLGGIDTQTGQVLSPQHRVVMRTWPGPRTSVFGASTLGDALALPPRNNAEGLVVRFRDSKMLKIKQADYVRLHKAIFNLTERAVWENAAAGIPIADIIEGLPDEVHPWIRKVYGGLHDKVNAIAKRAWNDFSDASAFVGVTDRKAFAQWVSVHSENPSLMFLLLDDRMERFNSTVWKMVEPSHVPYSSAVQEVA